MVRTILAYHVKFKLNKTKKIILILFVISSHFFLGWSFYDDLSKAMFALSNINEKQ